MTEIRLDFDRILDTALLGVRRASIFIGFGVNAATDPAFKTHALTKFSNLQIGPSQLTGDALAEAKENFRLWIEAAGFRELADSLGVFLDEVHWACAVSSCARNGGQVDRRKFDSACKSQSCFAGEGLPNKLNLLQQRFGITAQHESELKSLNKARNCLTHRRGVVGPSDLSEGSLYVSWLGMDLSVVEPNGNEHLITHEMPPIYLPVGGNVTARMTTRLRVFSMGDVVNFSTHDLAEICWFYEREARFICNAAIELAKRIDVTDSVQG